MTRSARTTTGLSSFPGRYYVGIDENGMGPRLGPLIVTSVLVELDEAFRDAGKIASSRPRGAIAKRIGDSKKLVAFEDNALGEAWARAIARAMGFDPATPHELLSVLALESHDELTKACPSHHLGLCWDTHGETFASDEASVRVCTNDLARLEAKGVVVRRARVATVCTRRLNDAVDRGLSRFDLDLHTMERLTLAARQDVDADVYALCGKVGGFDFYGPRFGPLAGRLFTTLVEGRARSEYLVPGVGRLAFVRDADESNLVVGLASLVGKWVRDHMMRRVVRYHRELDPDLPDASGYHDPVTARFVRASELVRKKRNIEPECFERTALGRRVNLELPTSSAPRTKKAPAQSQLRFEEEV